MQSLDPRARLIIHQRTQAQSQAQVQAQAQTQAQGQGHLIAVGQQISSQQMPTSIVEFSSQQVQSVSSQGSAPAPAASAAQPPQAAVHSMTESQEIPDSVTAELEKLEQEGGAMSEVDNVTDILGGLVEDDDELLGQYFIWNPLYSTVCVLLSF